MSKEITSRPERIVREVEVLSAHDSRHFDERNPAVLYLNSLRSKDSRLQAGYKLARFAKCWSQLFYKQRQADGTQLPTEFLITYSEPVGQILQFTPWRDLTSLAVTQVVNELCYGEQPLKGIEDRTRKDGKARSASKSTYNQYIAALKNVAKFAAKAQVIDPAEYALIAEIQLRRLPASNKSEYFTPEQARQLIDHCLTDQSIRGLRDATMFALYFVTAARRSAIANLEVKDINHQRQEIRVITKGDEEQILPLSIQAHDLLVTYLDEANINDGKVFRRISKSGRLMTWADCDPTKEKAHNNPNLTGDGIYKTLKKRLLEAGLPSFHPHSFRRGRLTQLRDHGADIFTLQALANHRQLETTKRYLKGVEEDVREAVRSLDF